MLWDQTLRLAREKKAGIPFDAPASELCVLQHGIKLSQRRVHIGGINRHVFNVPQDMLQTFVGRNNCGPSTGRLAKHKHYL